MLSKEKKSISFLEKKESSIQLYKDLKKEEEKFKMEDIRENSLILRLNQVYFNEILFLIL